VKLTEFVTQLLFPEQEPDSLAFGRRGDQINATTPDVRAKSRRVQAARDIRQRARERARVRLAVEKQIYGKRPKVQRDPFELPSTEEQKMSREKKNRPRASTKGLEKNQIKDFSKKWQ